MEVIPQSFYARDVQVVARELIGCYLVRSTPEGQIIGKIVETEAYAGADDRAAHTFSNRPTPRTTVIFGEPGRAYVYTMHTHQLLNVVAREEGIPHAVLIRAVEPVEGLSQIAKHRSKVKKQTDWTNGPGKLTKAMAIDSSFYGHCLTEPPLQICQGDHSISVESSKRVGIKNSGEAADYLWRYSEVGNPYVSKYRP